MIVYNNTKFYEKQHNGEPSKQKEKHKMLSIVQSNLINVPLAELLIEVIMTLHAQVRLLNIMLVHKQ